MHDIYKYIYIIFYLYMHEHYIVDFGCRLFWQPSKKCSVLDILDMFAHD